MALRFTAPDNPSSPSFDAEAASQQLLAEASSPVRRPTTAPPVSSITAQRGADLLNAARALPMPSPAPVRRADNLPKTGQLKSQKLQKSGKLPRASLAGLVSEGSQKKARGKQMYDIEPSPQKKRASLPAQIAALEDEDDDIVLETSQVQSDDDASAEIPETLDVSAPKEAFGDDDIVDAPTSPIAPPQEEVTSVTKKQRGRPRKSGDSVASLADGEDETEEVILMAETGVVSSAAMKQRGRPRKSINSGAYSAAEEASVVGNEPPIADPTDEPVETPKKPQVQPRKSGNSVASRTSETGAAKVQKEIQEESPAEPKKRLGRPRESGASTASRPSDVDSAQVYKDFPEDVLKETQQQAQQPAVAVKPKRKGRPERDIDTHTHGEASAESRPVKKVKKLKGPKMVSPDEPEFEDGVLPPIATPRQHSPTAVHKDIQQESREIRRQERRQHAHAVGGLHPRVEIPIRSTRARSTRPQVEPISAPKISTAAVPTAAIARNTKNAIASSANEPARSKKTSRKIHISFHDPASTAGAGDEDDEEDAQAAAMPNCNRETDEKVGANTGVTNDDHERDDDRKPVPTDHDAEASSGVQDDGRDDGRDDEPDEDADAATEGAHLSDLDKVFKFVDGKGRPGMCAVGLAKQIRNMCKGARRTISAEDCSYDDMKACKDDIVHLLAGIRTDLHEDSRLDFKHDAFAYLFRALTRVLEAMYDKLRGDDEAEEEEKLDITESLEAMQILHPFIRDMLRFKDTMDSWRVKVQGRAQDDRLIKDVEINLITSLRIVEKDFKIQLHDLRKAEQGRQARVEIQRQQERQEQEMIRQEEALRFARERRKRWQDLHILRMQYEPDPYRRRRLRFVEPPATAEIDANGNEFERVPFFRERNAPPPPSVATTSGKGWTPEQDTALLDALQSFACKFASHITFFCVKLTRHAALEDIFRDYCGPRGDLRDFSVSDFAAKLAWVRSTWAQLLHLHPDWELPEWVRKIPVLP
ncbi:hypothetical protein N0V86_008436 [Didymella sp. IMI 355093]|nr:hypothetical protein N0V86_008436 [Didymella sp. IMI 355093]